MKTTSAALILLFSMLVFAACKKETDPASHPTDGLTQTQIDSIARIPSVPYPQTPAVECRFSPDYGDSIFFPQPGGGQDYVITPTNNQGVTGQYFSWPEGLSLNISTGAIDITKSISGVRYAVGFVQQGTADTCLSQIILGGASYADSVYSLSKSDITSIPYFNGNQQTPSPCNGSGPDDGNKCAFVDLKNSMKRAMFGPFPFDGETVVSTFYYQLSDNSNNAVQQMQIKFIYYSDRSAIPASLLSQVEGKTSALLNGILIGTTGSPKPPLIIIIRN
jgi:hypothetical protein